MSMTDPISSMLTCIRNANQVYKEKVDIPFSKIKLEIVRILTEEGFIQNYKVVEEKGRRDHIRITLRYGGRRERVLEALKRISRPGKRVYVRYEGIKPVLGGTGISILSTSKGILTNKQAKKQKVGGEILCTIQ
jgi:small subunit ribosomal protein S8